MGNGNQIDFDEAMAKQWKSEVRAEIDSVNQLLQKVGEACQEIPGEDDTVIKTIYEVGTDLQEKWKTLIDGFNSLDDAIGNVINKYSSNIAKSVDDLLEFKAKIGL